MEAPSTRDQRAAMSLNSIARNLSAQRARNEGFAFAMEHEPNVAFVQFVDGDCELADGWPERGIAALNARQDAGGLRPCARDPSRSNRL